MPPNVTLADLGESWKVQVSKVYVGVDFHQEWGAQLYKAGPTGRWRRVGYLVVSDKGPLEAVGDLLLALNLGKLRAR